MVFFVLIYNQVTKAKQTHDSATTNNSERPTNTQRPRSVLVAYSTDDVVVTVTPLYYQSDDVTEESVFDPPPSYEEAMKMPVDNKSNF